MNVQEEVELFKRYANRFKGDSMAVLGISSVHLAQQLDKYISPALDLGWVIRCILDINSENLFSNSRTPSEELATVLDNSVHPEYKYAEFIIKLCDLFLHVSESKELSIEEAGQYILTKDSEFYFGGQLAELSKELLSIACPEIKVLQ